MTFVSVIERHLTSNEISFQIGGRTRSLYEILCCRLPISDLAQTLEAMLGVSTTLEFFDGYEPIEPGPRFHLAALIFNIVSRSVSIADSELICVDAAQLESDFSNIIASIASGKIDYVVTFRLANIDVFEPIELSENTIIQKATPEDIVKKYPIERRIFGVAEQSEIHWLNHRVEVVSRRCGKPSELQAEMSAEAMNALENSIMHSFLLADLPSGLPNITHVRFDSPIFSSCHLRNMNVAWSTPRELINDEICALRRAFRFLSEAQNDRVLETAVDRFLIGKKRNLHHPNRVNCPNWDKLVDYVISMETLLLTVTGSSVEDELSYRFRLNGTTLLLECTTFNHSQLFEALKHLYTLRSKIVHGCEEKTVLKPAAKFIESLELNSVQIPSPLTLLRTIVGVLEDWIYRALIRLVEMPLAARPYRMRNGWEKNFWRMIDESPVSQ